MVEHMRPAEAYMEGWRDRELQLRNEEGGLDDRLVAPHARRLTELLDSIYNIAPGPTGRVIACGFPSWEEEALAVANGMAA